MKSAGIVTCVLTIEVQQIISVPLCYSVDSVLKKIAIEIWDYMSILQHGDTEIGSYTEKSGYDYPTIL